MSDWEKLCPQEDLPDGSQKVFPIGAMEVLIIHEGKRYYACANECPHLGECLEGGEVHGHVIRCNGHGFKLDLSNGKCLTEGELELPLFKVEVRDGWVCVKA